MGDGARPNIYTEEWQRQMEHGGFGLRGARVGAQAGAAQLGITVYEIDPGKKNLPYHAHLGIEEVIVVLKGAPTLRSPEGERQLTEGEVVAWSSWPRRSPSADQPRQLGRPFSRPQLEGARRRLRG